VIIEGCGAIPNELLGKLRKEILWPCLLMLQHGFEMRWKPICYRSGREERSALDPRMQLPYARAL